MDPSDPFHPLSDLFLHHHGQLQASHSAQQQGPSSAGYYEHVPNTRSQIAGDGTDVAWASGGGVPAKRSWDEAQMAPPPPPHANRPRPGGACTRCKKVKMKCSFANNDTQCARCIVGGFECIVPGRKPRSPGMRDILRKQIKEKDAMIDQLLNRLNPSPSLATPLAIVPSRLALTPEQRIKHQSVLAWLEKHRSGSRTVQDAKAKVDISALEDDPVSDDSMDEGSDDYDGEEDVPRKLLNELDFAPAGPAPAGILASTVLSLSRHQSPIPRSSGAEEDSRDLRVEGGIGSKSYFAPGPSTNLELRRLIVERQAAPEILLSGLVTYDDAIKLFDIYYKTIHLYVPMLDENIHTPAAVLGRCPFLFTVVCTLASRYYDEKPHIYSLATHLAKASAGNSFIGGWKTLEMCQAYFLLGGFSPPARRWEEDRSWFYTGLSFRMAMELNLNRIPDVKPTDERGQRELLNRLRTWVVCYVLDRCMCLNLGKPFMMPEDDIICHLPERFLGWTYQQPSDSYVVSLAELLRIITRFSERVNPVFEHQVNIRQHSDLMMMHKVTDTELIAWKKVVEERVKSQEEPNSVANKLQHALLSSVFQYSRLVTFSVGLQQVVKEKRFAQDVTFFEGCLNAACAVLELMLTELLPSGLIRCSPEQVFTLTAFATAVLIKFLRPQYAAKLSRVQEDRIIDLVKRLLEGLAVGDLGVDDSHVSRRYARFLTNLLQPHIREVEERRAAEDCKESQPEVPQQFQAHDPGPIPLPPFQNVSSNMYETALMPPGPDQSHSDFGQTVYTGHSYEHAGQTDFSNSIWDDTLPSSEGDAVPMPPILGYPDPGFLASMFSYTEHPDPAQFF